MSDNAYPFLSELDLTDEVRNKLSLQLRRLELGNDEIYVTPLGANGKAELILEELNSIINENSDQLNDVLMDLEMSNKSKFGPRSIAAPWSERKNGVLESFESAPNIGNLDILPAPTVNNLRPVDLSTALSFLKNNTNSGLPYYTRKSDIKDRLLQDFDYLMDKRYPCILFTRTQEGGKTRTVWGFPVADTLNEMRIYRPLLEHQKKQNYRSALVGPDKVGRAICVLVLEAQDKLRTLVSIDFSFYDQSVKGGLQKPAFSFIKSLFQMQYSTDISYIESRFLSIGLVTPEGIIYGEHGVPSGSTFTNEVDSIAQMLISIQLPYINMNNMQVQGDDGVYLIPRGKEDELFRQFKAYGLSVNEEKSYVSSDYAIYLQCLYHIDYIRKGIIGGIYPIYRALNRLCFQERWSDFEDYNIVGKDYYSIRALCILENCKHHPLFRIFTKLILKHDKYSLDFTDQGLSNYMHMLESTKGAEGILLNQYGDDIKGIRSFESYKLVKELG